jgi:EAL domain-containing protein (putative c-di-GMP-specific phosphodiesterase class I)
MGLPELNISNLIKERSFYTEFQPLWNNLNDSIFAYEAFIRTAPSINPFSIFHSARKQGLLYEIDTASISNAIKEYPYTYLDKYLLFVNVFPSTIVHPDFPKFIELLLTNYKKIKTRLVFEINEDSFEESYWEEQVFLERLSFLKSQGFLIAYDDLTHSLLSINKIVKFQPDFAKLDRSCSERLSSSPKKQQSLDFFLTYSHQKLLIILEGIETNEDFETSKKMGVPLLQGYYMAKPHRL